MELLSSVAIMGAFLLMALIGACLLVALWQQGWGDARPVLFDQLLRRQGDEVARRALGSGSAEFARAVRQCVGCNEATQCRAWLYSGAREGYETFCPNAGFVHRIKLSAS